MTKKAHWEESHNDGIIIGKRMTQGEQSVRSRKIENGNARAIDDGVINRKSVEIFTDDRRS